MYRAAVRPAVRTAAVARRSRPFLRAGSRGFASTKAPADKRRSWKSSVLRWGLAAGAVYYYSTSSVFADETPEPQALIPAPSPFAEADLPTVEAVAEEKRKQAADRPSAVPEPEKQPEPELTAAAGSPQALEEEASQEGAFSPETGEINWDCPCLGGMAHGPCGDEFKAAFSCFVYSTEEPKGMDCIDKFQGMQECFRQYPDVYGAELADDEPLEEYPAVSDEPSQVGKPTASDQDELTQPPQPQTPAAGSQGPPRQPHEPETQALRGDVSEPEPVTAVLKPETQSSPGAKSAEGPAPARWADATSANDEVKKAEEKRAGSEAK